VVGGDIGMGGERGGRGGRVGAAGTGTERIGEESRTRKQSSLRRGRGGRRGVRSSSFVLSDESRRSVELDEECTGGPSRRRLSGERDL
jgi:hypothetical protein